MDHEELWLATAPVLVDEIDRLRAVNAQLVEAARMAVAALDGWREFHIDDWDSHDRLAMEKLRTALAAAGGEQEEQK